MIVPKKKAKTAAERTAVKRPQLSTQGLPLSHVVAIRCLELSPDPVNPSLYFCNDESKPWVVRPQALAAVLAFENCEATSEFMRLQLTAESADYVDNMWTVPEWWPVQENEDEETGEVAVETSLFVPKKRGRRKGKKGSKKTKAKGQDKDADGKDANVDTKKKKKKLKKAKADAAAEPVEFSFANIKKTKTGKRLIAETMVRLKNLDHAHFPNPAFNAEGECMIPTKQCEKKTWDDIMKGAAKYLTDL